MTKLKRKGYDWIDIVHLGFASFMDNDCEDDLSMLYRLLRKVNALDLCVKHFREYVKVNGLHDSINLY